MTNPSPDISAAEVVAWRHISNAPRAKWTVQKNRPDQIEKWPGYTVDPLVPKALLDTSRAETAAANARADALERERDEMGRLYRAGMTERQELGRTLARALEAMKALADSADSMSWSVNSGLADDAINNARRALAEIEGKSQ